MRSNQVQPKFRHLVTRPRHELVQASALGDLAEVVAFGEIPASRLLNHLPKKVKYFVVGSLQFELAAENARKRAILRPETLVLPCRPIYPLHRLLLWLLLLFFHRFIHGVLLYYDSIERVQSVESEKHSWATRSQLSSRLMDLVKNESEQHLPLGSFC